MENNFVVFRMGVMEGTVPMRLMMMMMTKRKTYIQGCCFIFFCSESFLTNELHFVCLSPSTSNWIPAADNDNTPPSTLLFSLCRRHQKINVAFTRHTASYRQVLQACLVGGGGVNSQTTNVTCVTSLLYHYTCFHFLSSFKRGDKFENAFLN